MSITYACIISKTKCGSEGSPQPVRWLSVPFPSAELAHIEISDPKNRTGEAPIATYHPILCGGSYTLRLRCGAVSNSNPRYSSGILGAALVLAYCGVVTNTTQSPVAVQIRTLPP